jgi:hypothetical protein
MTTDATTAITQELRRTVTALFGADDVVELRAFLNGVTFSGYFDDHDELIRRAASYDERGADVYVTLNELPKDILFRRYNRTEQIKGRAVTTSDNDVERRRSLFIDADCERVSGVSSTHEEKRKSQEKVLEIRSHLRGQGWPEPIVCDSGNGSHLLYRIDLPNDKASLELITGVLGRGRQGGHHHQERRPDHKVLRHDRQERRRPPRAATPPL